MSIEAMKQEPVAYMDDKGYICNFTTNPERYTPLYTAPPKREWVGLASDDVISLCKQFLQPRHSDLEVIYFARAIEAKLREKNS